MVLKRWNQILLSAWFLSAALLALPTLASTAADDESDPRVLARDGAGVPTFLAGDLGALDTKALAEDEAAAKAGLDFLRQLTLDELGALGDEELVVHRVRRDELGKVHVRVKQRLGGLPVVGADLILHAEAATGEVYAVNGRFISSAGLAVRPLVEAVEAIELAAAEAGIAGKVLDEPELVYVLGSDDRAYLAWRQLLEYESAAGLELDDLFADAETGALVARHPRVHRAKSWQTFTANNGTNLPGTLRCTNNQSCGDLVLQNIHDHTSETYDYYLTKFGRDSYNGAGITSRSVGHYGTSYVNAHWWNGTYLVYGDGDGSQSGPLGNALDVVAHEFTHAVTQYESGLIYANESGALNEAWSDIFGAAAEAWLDGFVNANTWKVGEDTWTPGIPGDALRYMNHPTLDGASRDYYPERYTGSADNGGVHWNSGIANLAFYLLVQGGSHPRGKTSVTVTAIGMGQAEQIFYRAQTHYLTSSSNFLAARNATGLAALELYGATARDRVHTAWCAVGVGSCPGGGVPAAPATLTEQPGFCRGLYDFSWSSVSGATSYELYASTSPTFPTQGLRYSGPNTTTFQSFPSGGYYLRVRACNASGCGPYKGPVGPTHYYSPCL